MTTATYLRLSTADKGDSIAAQRELCAKWLQDNGITDHVEYAEDAQSASKKSASKRPEWVRLVADIRSGAVTRVVARHLDRLTRRTLDLEELVELVEETGVEFVTLWSGALDLNSPAGRQTARILVSVAQGESETKAERIKAQKAYAREHGKATGGPRPFGYETHYGPLREDEADLVRRGIEAVLDGASMYAVQRMFAESGIPTRRGAPEWNKKTVREILLRWRNAGRVEHRGQDAGEGQFPAIVPLGTMHALRAVLLDPSRARVDKDSMRGPKATTLLSGIAQCGACGSPLKARTNVVQRQKNGVREQVGRVGVYACSAPKCHVSIRRDLFDTEATNAMMKFYASVVPADLVPEADQTALAEAYAEKEATDTERAGVVQMMTDGLLKPAEASRVLASLGDRLGAVEGRIETLMREHAVAASVAAPLLSSDGHASFEAHAALKEKWLSQSLEQRRRQLDAVLVPIVQRRHHASGMGLPDDLKERARIEFTNRVQPGKSFTLLDEIMAEKLDN